MYDRAAYERTRRRRRAMERLGLLLDYRGPLTDRGIPIALGDWILARWLSDSSRSSAEKVERLLNTLEASPEVAEREIADYLEALDVEFDGLTISERRTLYLTSLGFQIKEIARFDAVTIDAVKERLRAARRKLRAANTTHAVAIAIRKDLLWH